MPRSTAQQVIERREELGKILRLKLTRSEALRELNRRLEQKGEATITRSTMMIDLRWQRQADTEWLQSLAARDYPGVFRSSIKFLEDRQQDLLAIGKNPEVKSIDRIVAEKATAEIEVEILNLLSYGIVQARTGSPLTKEQQNAGITEEAGLR